MALWVLIEPTTGVVDAAIPGREQPERPGLEAWEVGDVDLWNRIVGEVRSRSRDGRLVFRPVRVTRPDPPRPLVASDITRVSIDTLDNRPIFAIEVSEDAGATWVRATGRYILTVGDRLDLRLALVRPNGQVRDTISGLRLIQLGARDRSPMPYLRVNLVDGLSQAYRLDTSEPRDVVIDGSPDVQLHGSVFRARIYHDSVIV